MTMNEKDRVVPPTELVIFAPVVTQSDDLSTVANISNNELHFPTVVTLNVNGNGVDTNAKPYTCDKCGLSFKQLIRYERHIANHPKKKSYVCKVCQKTFSRLTHLEKHSRTHSDERKHVCNTCGAAFILPHHLTRHLLIHTGHRPFECEVCQKQFTRKAGLTQHMFVHNGLKPYVCEIENCGKQFTDKTTLRRHVLTHSREKPFICKECDKTFRTKAACRKHYLRHFKHEESFKCGVCEEMFKTEDDLKVHNEIHKLKQKVGIFRCGFCLRVFKSQEDLDIHVPLHESGLQFKCAQCSVKFYTESDLVSHMSRHNNQSLLKEQTKEMPPLQIAREGMINVLPECDENLTSTNMTTTFGQSLEAGKVLVVLQLPNSTQMKTDCGTLQLQSIQQLIGSAQVDRLLVTTDKVNDSFSLNLSQDQQQGIQQILQTTNIDPNDCIRSSASVLNVDEKETELSSPFINGELSSVNRDIPTEQINGLNVGASRKLGESVFISPVRNDVIKHHSDAVDVVNSSSLTTSFSATLNSSISPTILKGYQLYDTQEDYHNANNKLNENIIDQNKELDTNFRDNKSLEPKTLFSGEFPSLCDGNMLGEDVPHFAIVSTS